MIEIKIPATSANLGAGFDSLGLAVGMYNRVLMEPWEGIAVEVLDDTPIPTDQHNLVYKTVQYLFDICGKKLDGLRIIQENNIPMARGLGSSSACIVAGLVGANLLMGEPLSQADLINMAAAMEGHPDNSTPAILGGQVTAAMEHGKVFYCRQELRDDLRFVAVIPDFEMKTSEARAALSREIDRKDAVYNLSRAALTAASLAAGDYRNLRVSMCDRLHQPTRLRLIHGGQDVLDCCLELGAYGAYLSGAGPTLMAVIPTEDNGIVQQLRCFLDNRKLESWRVELLEPDNQGVVVSWG